MARLRPPGSRRLCLRGGTLLFLLGAAMGPAASPEVTTTLVLPARETKGVAFLRGPLRGEEFMFAYERWPLLQRMEFSLADSTGGTPPGVTCEPGLVVGNNSFQSMFVGNLNDALEMDEFVGTARHFAYVTEPLGPGPWFRFPMERAQYFLRVVFHPLSGHIPKDLDVGGTEAAVRIGVVKGLPELEPATGVLRGPMDRAFELEFSPFFAGDGRFSLAWALHPAADPFVTLATNGEAPARGDWRALPDIVARVTQDVDGALRRELTGYTSGFGARPLHSRAPVATWEELGALPDANPGTPPAPVAVPHSWTTVASDSTTATLHFRCAVPMEGYSGRAGVVRAGLELAADGSMRGASGFVSVETSSLTMAGGEDMDSTMRDVLHVSAIREARFDLQNVTGERVPLRFGVPTTIEGHGTLGMAGATMPVDVTALVRPVLTRGEEPRLDVRARFEVSLRSFGITPPEGPRPLSDRMYFFVRLVMAPGNAGLSP